MAILFGGVDYESNEQNQFHNDFINQQKYFSSNGWDTHVLFSKDTKYFKEHSGLEPEKIKPAKMANLIESLDLAIKNLPSLILAKKMNMNSHSLSLIMVSIVIHIVRLMTHALCFLNPEPIKLWAQSN